MVRLIYSVQTYISPQQGNTIKTWSKYTMTRKQRSNHQTSPKYNHNATPKCNSNTPKIYNIIEILVSPCPILNNLLPPFFFMSLTQSRRNIPAIGWLLLIQCPIRFPPVPVKLNEHHSFILLDYLHDAQHQVLSITQEFGITSIQS